jgi:tetratricopeptide (TPR) repeat protein
MTLRLTLISLFSAATLFAAQPKIPECFKVHALLKMDQDHYWANWSNACPYTIDSVYVAVQFSDRAGTYLGDGLWALHFILPGAHRIIRFTTPGAIADFDFVRVHKITSSSEEALLNLTRPADRPKPQIPGRVGDPGNAVLVETVSAEEHQRRGRELIESMKYVAAIAELSEVIREKPDSWLAYNARGFARYMSHQYRPALEDFDQAIRLNPKYLNAYQNRSQARKAVGDLSGSAADARAIHELSQSAR